MQLFLALSAACSWGAGNFAMGIAGRRASARITVLISFTAGLIGALLYLGIQRPHLDSASLAWGFVAGIAQGIGWTMFSTALKRGRISVVAPLTSTTAATGLYLSGVATEGSVSIVSLGGALFAILAIVLLSLPSDRNGSVETDKQGHRDENSRTAIIFSLLAGLLFTGQFLAMNHAGDDSGAWVMTGSRLAIALIVGGSLMFWPQSTTNYRQAIRLAAPAGMVILAGDLLYLSALASGPLTTASVLGGLHPITTIGHARLFLKEPVIRAHEAGIVLAILGTGLIAFG